MKIGEASGEIRIDVGPFNAAMSLVAQALQRAIGNAIASVGSVSAAFEEMGRVIGQGFAAGIADREYWRPRDDAPRVRPVGRRSNSREWLAWDYRTRAWRPVVRHQGGEWWWK